MGTGLDESPQDIGDQDININIHAGKKLSKHENNNKSRVQLVGEPKQLLNNMEVLDHNNKEKLFNQRIGSI